MFWKGARRRLAEDFMADVRIYQPTKNAMQSGRANSKRWVLEFEPGRKQTDSLMGWVGSADTRNQLKLRFASKEAAIAYADKHGLDYVVQEPKKRRVQPKSYAANFAYDRID